VSVLEGIERVLERTAVVSNVDRLRAEHLLGRLGRKVQVQVHHDQRQLTSMFATSLVLERELEDVEGKAAEREMTYL
jgi:hypothetical protein